MISVLILFLMPPHKSLVVGNEATWKQMEVQRRNLGIDAPSDLYFKLKIAQASDSILIPVVLIKYPDYSNTYTVNEFQNELFGSWSTGSARDFYIENSYGQFAVNGQVTGWYTSNNNKNYYGYNRGWVRAAMLAKEAAQKSDPYIDYSQFDMDKDGYVDNFSVIHAGYGMEESGNRNDIWSHKWSFSGAGIGVYTTDDYDPQTGTYTKIDDYTMEPERSNYSQHGTMVSIGVFVHEWGHALGLPDLYDTDYSGEGLGNWSVMAGGSWGGNGSSPWYPVHFDAWSKEYFGWITPVVITTNAFRELPPVEDSAKIYKLWTNGSPVNEYFLVSFRKKKKFDVNLPGEGMLIYHIDWNVINANWNSNTVNSGNPYGVALEQADGNDDLFNGNNRGDAGDPYPGSTNNTAFDSLGTNPDSRSNAGQNTHCGVNQISFLSGTRMKGFFYINSSALGEEAKRPKIKENISLPQLLGVFATSEGLKILFKKSLDMPVTVKVYNSAGKITYKEKFPFTPSLIMLNYPEANLETDGIYFITVSSNKQRIGKYKIIKVFK